MKKNLILIGLILVVGILVSDSTAQTSKTSKQKPTPAKSPEADKTRSRRTATSPTPAATPSPAEKVEKVEPAAETAKPTEPPKPTESPKPSASTESNQATVPELKEQAQSEPSPIATPSKPDAPAVVVDETKALRDQIEAASTANERLRLQLKLAELLVTAGKKAEALAELRSVVGIDTFDPQGFYNAGNALARLGESDGAIEAYRKAIDQRKGNYSRACNNLGVVLLRLGRWDEAYDALSTALKLENFRYPEASYNLGRLYAARGQADLAVREWRRVLAMNPQHAGAKDALARVGSDDRVLIAPAQSMAARQNSDQNKPPVSAALEKPAALKPTPTGARPTTSALSLDQTSYDFLQRARTSVERGKTNEAIDSYKRIINRQAGYFPPANLELGFAYLSLKQYDEALANLLLVANRDGRRYPISYFHVARVYELKGDFNQAQLAYSKAVLAFGEQNPQFLLDVSRVKEKIGDFKGALEAMESYILLMKKQDQEPSWSEERLTALRQKVTAATVKN